MARYSYKSVVYRDDFQAAIPEWERANYAECDHDASYLGDYWSVAAFLLDKKEAENARLRAALAQSQENCGVIIGMVADRWPNDTNKEQVDVLLADALEHIDRILADPDGAAAYEYVQALERVAAEAYYINNGYRVCRYCRWSKNMHDTFQHGPRCPVAALDARR